MRKSAFYKDIGRTLKNNLSRFIAITAMAALGIGVFSGFAVGCLDTFESADHLYDKQNTYDIKIVSTLGLSDDDLLAVSKVKGVNSVFGSTSMDVKALQSNENSLLANLNTLDTKGMNEPYVLDGTLPTQPGQIAVNTKFIEDTGLKVGDSIKLVENGKNKKTSTEDTTTTESENDDKTDFGITIEGNSSVPALAVKNYKITAEILSPLNIKSTKKGIANIAFSSSSSDYLMYVTADCIKSDIYDAVYVTIDDASKLDSYSPEYQDLVDNMTAAIKSTIQEKRQQARYNQVVEAANSKISEAEGLLNSKMVEAEQKLSDAQIKIDDGWASVNDGQAELLRKETELSRGEQALSDAQKSANEKFSVAQKEIDNGWIELKAGEEKLNQEAAAIENSDVPAAQKAGALKQISDARRKIEDEKAKLISGQKKLDNSKAEAKTQFAKKQAEIIDGKQKLADARKKLKESEAKLVKGQAELDKNKSDYKNSIADAKKKLEDARGKVTDIGMAKWYIWDRTDNDSIAGLKSDVSFIQEVTRAFPIIFFLVAVLICLTTMTRMVEENRGLIGTYKSLGYSNRQISMKFIFYAVLACFIGGIFGNLIGFIVLPKVIEIIISSLYVLPTYKLYYNFGYGLAGFGLFLLGIAGATSISCVEMLHQCPAELMRPKAPKAGTRILLERIPLIWKRVNFLNKVTCRNLFRYKKRAVMTIVGILGCTMLIVLAYGVKDTVGGLMSDQFDNVTVYDAIVATDKLNVSEMNILANEWKASENVKDEQQLQIKTLTLRSGSGSLDITVMAIPDSADLEHYIHLNDSGTHKAMVLPHNGIVVTQNAAKKLAITAGDIVSMQNEDNLEHDFPVAFVATNYAGNYVYVSESCYQAAFGDYAGNSFLLNLTDNKDGHKWLDDLSNDNRIISVSSSQSVRDAFNDVNRLITMVVYLLISMSAVLALTVLFTLSNINISERERELATIKVLGFQNGEVYSYVNRETFILTLLGILCGLPAGFGITYAILANVSIAGVAFKVRVSLISYLIAAIITLIFALLVNKITNKELRKINMVEALKSVE